MFVFNWTEFFENTQSYIKVFDFIHNINFNQFNTNRRHYAMTHEFRFSFIYFLYISSTVLCWLNTACMLIPIYMYVSCVRSADFNVSSDISGNPGMTNTLNKLQLSSILLAYLPIVNKLTKTKLITIQKIVSGYWLNWFNWNVCFIDMLLFLFFFIFFSRCLKKYDAISYLS